MEQYKDLWISGHATPGYPGGNNSTPGATVLYQRPDDSVVDRTTLKVHNFAENHDVATLIGLELARLIVGTCYPELLGEREEIEQENDKLKTAAPKDGVKASALNRMVSHCLFCTKCYVTYGQATCYQNQLRRTDVRPQCQ